MAVFTLARRFMLNNASFILWQSQISHFSSLLPAPCCILSAQLPQKLVEAFHRTPIELRNGSRYFSSINHFHNQNLRQLINFDKYMNHTNGDIQVGVGEFVETVRKTKYFASGDEALAFLDNSGVKPSKDLIFSVIWALREDWKLAFLAFKWGEKWDCIVERTWCLIIWVLGNHQKFSTAWCLIHDLYTASLDTQQAMLIMTDRYAAANYPDKSVQTFLTMEKFKFSPDQRTFLTFLNILCSHGYIERAEEFMYQNKKFFPLETEGFNIILNGWCNVTIDIYEAKRVWREMSNCCILPDGTSYSHMISCFSSTGNLFNSLRLYDEMKKNGWIPGMEVYNSLVHVLARENCLNEALRIVEKMKEAGFQPDSMTYNSMILPLCEIAKFEEAKVILARMIEEDVSPTIDTYHALLEGASLEETLGVLTRIEKAGLGPSRDTFLLALRRFSTIEQPENALRIWSEMKRYAIVPDSAHYNILVKGLARGGLANKAREFFAEMRSAGLVGDPKMKKLLKDPEQDRSHERKECRRIQRGKSSTIRRRLLRKQSEKRKTS